MVQIPNLECLNLSFNRLEKLPSTLQSLTRLRQLHLIGNDMINLPCFLFELRNLELLSHEWAALNHQQLIFRTASSSKLSRRVRHQSLARIQT